VRSRSKRKRIHLANIWMKFGNGMAHGPCNREGRRAKTRRRRDSVTDEGKLRDRATTYSAGGSFRFGMLGGAGRRLAKGAHRPIPHEKTRDEKGTRFLKRGTRDAPPRRP